MRLKVEVTEKDIRRGKCGDANQCAIAQALLRTAREKLDTKTAKVQQVEVWPHDRVHVEMNDGTMYTATITERADRFIRKFDNEDEWDPKTGTIKKPLGNLPKLKRVQPTTFIFNFTEL